jgi:hypothetical protein
MKNQTLIQQMKLHQDMSKTNKISVEFRTSFTPRISQSQSQLINSCDFLIMLFQ